MKPREFVSEIVDLSVDFGFVEDYSIEVHENVVVEARLELSRGFIDIYRNFETGKVAFAWIEDSERIFGADNTGGWHLHPIENPAEHRESPEIDLKEFLEQISGKI